MPLLHRKPWGRSIAWLIVSAWLMTLTAIGVGQVSAGEAPKLTIEVDARGSAAPASADANSVALPARQACLWFPKWVPGAHGPIGPVQNVAGLRVETSAGIPVQWHRDESEPFRIECNVPGGVTEITVLLDTICDSASHRSFGHLSYGNYSLGIIHWITCLVYPEGYSCDDIRVELRLRLPSAWRCATSLRD